MICVCLLLLEEPGLCACVIVGAFWGTIHVWISFGLESKYLHDLGSLVEMEAFP